MHTAIPLKWNAVSLATGLMVLVAGGAGAAELPDTSSWECQYCPFVNGHRAEVEAGVSHASEGSARYGDARGYDEQGAYAELHGSGSYSSEAQQLRWRVEDAGLDARHLGVSGGDTKRYEYGIDYRELPRHLFDTTRTVFVQASDSDLVLPDGWVRAPTTSGFTGLASSLVGRDIGNRRRTLEIRGSYFPLEWLDVSASYRRRSREGLEIRGGPYFTQSALLPAPFEYATDEAELSLSYASRTARVKLGYFGSFFQNRNLALSWQTPFTSAPGAERAAMAQPPDNAFQQLSLAGAVAFDRADTVVGFNVATGRMQQDDVLLPYTTNDSIVTGPLPRQRLDGEVETGNVAVTLTSRPIEQLRLKFAYRLDDRDNTTPVETWTRVIADTFLSGEAEENTPYSFRKTRISASGRYQWFDTLQIGAGVERTDRERDFQEVAEQTEDSGWGMLRWRPNGRVEVRVKGGASERDIDRYDEQAAASLRQNPILRKYNLAYRYRRFAETTLTMSGAEKPVSLTLSAMRARDEYTQSRLGLVGSEDLRVAADLSLSLAKGAFVYVHGGYESIEADQFGSEQFATPDWSASSEDRFRTAGIGFGWPGIAENLDLKVDYTRSVGTTAVSLDSMGAGASQFPDLESKLDSLRLRLSWQRSERLSLNAGLHYESFAVEDWALHGVAPDTIPVVLTLGAEPYDYDVLLAMIGVSYRLGGQGTP